MGRKGRQEQLSIVRTDGPSRETAAGSPGDVNLSTLTSADGNDKKSNLSADELKQLEDRGRNWIGPNPGLGGRQAFARAIKISGTHRAQAHRPAREPLPPFVRYEAAAGAAGETLGAAGAVASYRGSLYHFATICSV